MSEKSKYRLNNRVAWRKLKQCRVGGKMKEDLDFMCEVYPCRMLQTRLKVIV